MLYKPLHCPPRFYARDITIHPPLVGSSSSGSSSSSHSSQNKDSSHKPATSPGARKSADPSSAGLDCVSAMFLDTKPDELIDQIFIILDDAEVKLDERICNYLFG